MPDPDQFPYTMRIVSDILESNGSSSMGTVCSGTMAMMDGGVPIKAPVSGIAMGLVERGPDRMGEVLEFPKLDGTVVRAKIVSPVFYDPEGEKQNV